MKIQTVDILGLEYCAMDYQGATDFVLERVRENRSASVFALPVHGIVEAHRSYAFKKATDSADLILPDGQPVRWLMNWFYKLGLEDRVYGPELVKHVLQQGQEQKLRVFLYGGATDEILNRFKLWVQDNFPEINIVGAYREPIFGETTLQVSEVSDRDAQLVLCGLGCPNQELWIADHANDISAVLMGVGAAFSFHSGVLETAPTWMQRNGLEWLFRLSREPARLWRRYLFTNTYFIGLVLRELLQRLFGAGRD